MRKLRERVFVQGEEKEHARALLTRQIIDAGIRAMARALHPDAGGSHEAMLELNSCADTLRRTFPKPKPVRKRRRESEATKLKYFLHHEQPRNRQRRQCMQSDSWGCWVGDSQAAEWITPLCGRPDYYAPYYPALKTQDLGFPRADNE